MITVKEVFLEISKKLYENNIESNNLDARILISIIINIEPNDIISHYDDMLSDNQINELYELVNRRIIGESIAKIQGYKYFWKHKFYTNKYTLDPRPDTESLIELFLESLPDKYKDFSMIEFGVGTGCIILTLLDEYKNSCGAGVDISKEAIDIASKNAIEIDLSNRIEFINSDMHEILSTQNPIYDFIISNPPYIPTADICSLAKEVKHENILALDGKEDGLYFYTLIAEYSHNLLKPGGSIFLEIGDGQFGDVVKIFEASGYKLNSYKKDLSGTIRSISFTYN